jgi:predicted component of type VI protein secretion system
LWRGLKWLVDGIEDAQVKVRLLDVRWTDLARDQERAMSFDQSHLFDLVYSQEFGMPGGEPFGMLIVDHKVSHRLGPDRTDDIAVLEGLGEVAGAAFCPIIVGADPRMAAMDGFEEIDLRQDLAATFADPAFARWNRLRSRPDSRFLAVVMPRMLARPLYCGRDHPRLGFVWDEQVADARDLLWTSGAFALAHVAGRAMARHRWPAAIRGTLPPGEGGTVGGPARQWSPATGEDRRPFFGGERGIGGPGTGTQRCGNYRPAADAPHRHGCLPQSSKPAPAARIMMGEAARMNAKMGAMLNYIFCVCRFAHYVKVMARDWVGRYSSARGMRAPAAGLAQALRHRKRRCLPEMRMRYPLREARVHVREIPGKPGVYGCEIAIRPHYQLDQISSEFR